MEQINFPFVCDNKKLQEFLARWLALEEEEDRVREEKRLCKEDYADHIPMRGVLTAVKVVRAEWKLERHPKEPMKRSHQSALQYAVEGYLTEYDAGLAKLMHDAEGLFEKEKAVAQ
jgi:hypothetical protein